MSLESREPDIHPENPLRTLSTVGGALCLDFTNTVDHRGAEAPNERLNTRADLVWWANRVGLLGADEVEGLVGDASARGGEPWRRVRRAVELREALYPIFSRVSEGALPEEGHLARLNMEVRRAFSLRELVGGDGRFRWSWTTGDVAARVLGEVALSAADLLAGPDLVRVGKCAGADCDWLFLDTSRNRSRRWCDMSECGNRAKARRYQRRHRRAP